MTLSSLIKRILANFDRVPTSQSAATGNQSRSTGLSVEDATSELWPLADEKDLEWHLYNTMTVINAKLGGQSPPRVAPRGIKLVQFM